jgi:[ribosomal protein S18]-alanine N-acetyltransferase
MARNNDVHPRTLAPVPTRLHIESEWPQPTIIKRGWSKAVARRWNDDVPDAAIRLERGSSDFLKMASSAAAEISGAGVYSPALYADASKVWKSAGFVPYDELDIMERPLGREDSVEPSPVEAEITRVSGPSWAELVEVDRMAFEGFWRMGSDGLVEAMTATPSAIVLQSRSDGELVGYALVGAQMTVAFLQRVAVAPERAGVGIGTDLVLSSMAWAASKGAQRLVLNVRPENTRAIGLYSKLGFSLTGKRLQVMRFES